MSAGIGTGSTVDLYNKRRKMMMLKLTGLLLRSLPGALLLTMFPSLVLAASAPDYPAKPIRIVVSFSPGGGTDIFARAMAQKYRPRSPFSLASSG